MNGVHDMGGMHGMGAIHYEKNEPVFHARWESRVFALFRLTRAWNKWNVDVSRRQIESIPAAQYLRMSYYERWFTALGELLVASGLITRAELVKGKRARGSPKATPPITAAQVASMPSAAALARREAPVAPRFQAGQQVRARNLHPVDHTRLPRYARGKLGAIHRDHGVWAFPDAIAHFLSDKPQHVYSVRFAARELWGETASPRDAVYLDLWDDYLEPA